MSLGCCVAVRLLFALAAVVLAASNAVAGTLQEIQKRGALVCGTGKDLRGFAEVDERGVWSGLDVDFCAALASAVLGRKDAVRYRPLAASERFSALTSGEVDIVARGVAWALSTDTVAGVRFVDPLVFDGQAFMVMRSRAIASALELSGAKICVLSGGTDEQYVAEFFLANRMRYEPLVFERWSDALDAYVQGRCAALTGAATLLATERVKLGVGAHSILPERASLEPLGPLVRDDDDQWASVVRWVIKVLIAGEVCGVNGGNIDHLRQRGPLSVRLLLGSEGKLGGLLGLPQDWAYLVLKQNGTYGDLWDRNLGLGSTLKLERGSNNVASKGGLMFAAPFR